MAAIVSAARKDVNTKIGTELEGVVLKDLDQPAVDELQQLAAQRGVLFFRDQKMTLADQVEIGSRLGELHIHPAAKAPEGFPEVLVVHTDAESTYTAGNGWHSDVSCDERPPALSMLRIEQPPPAGGDTVWASMYEAYDSLSQSMQQYLSTLTAVHSGDRAYQGRYRLSEAGNYPSSEHPVVRTHPLTKRKGLYVNMGFTSHIKGLKHRESDALLKMLYDHIAYNIQAQVRFQWEPNSVAIWDNRCVQHHASWDYFPQTRHGYRVTTRGEIPFQ